MSRPLVAKIDLNALLHNYQIAKKLSPKNPPIAVIKANAYGCGLIQVAQTLKDSTRFFAVSSIEEAMLLRENSITNPVLLLEGFFDKSEIPLLKAHNFIATIHSDWQIKYLAEAKIPSLPIWLKYNTGMNRLGFDANQIKQIVADSQNSTIGYKPQALLTHFATADVKNSEKSQSAFKQAALVASQTRMALSASNSAAILAFDFTDDFKRTGVMLYGASPLQHENANSQALQTVVELKSQIIAIHTIEKDQAVGYGETFVANKPIKIATVAGGYGDGISRDFYKSQVLVKNTLCDIIGRISMDMLSLDVSNVENPQVGDEVEFFGKNLDITQVAQANSTISYCLMTQLMQRIRREYKN